MPRPLLSAWLAALLLAALTHNAAAWAPGDCIAGEHLFRARCCWLQPAGPHQRSRAAAPAVRSGPPLRPLGGPRLHPVTPTLRRALHAELPITSAATMWADVEFTYTKPAAGGGKPLTVSGKAKTRKGGGGKATGTVTVAFPPGALHALVPAFLCLALWHS